MTISLAPKPEAERACIQNVDEHGESQGESDGPRIIPLECGDRRVRLQQQHADSHGDTNADKAPCPRYYAGLKATRDDIYSPGKKRLKPLIRGYPVRLEYTYLN